jgi:hypothetical protein
MKEKGEAKKLMVRYIDKAAEQENQLEALTKQKQDSMVAQDQLKEKAIALIKDFSLERTTVP